MQSADDGHGGGAVIDLAELFPRFPRPLCRVVLVSGPPGGGKSHHVAQHAAPGDVVMDLDAIMSELSGLPIYRADRARWLRPALAERNRRLVELATMPRQVLAWVIVSAPGTAWQWWRQALQPVRLVPVVPPQWKAEDNIRRDPRRAHALGQHLAACADWYARNGAAIDAAMRHAARERDRECWGDS
jgi:hypothetical protein